MLTSYNNDETRVITGSFTHNERIERLWRDVHRSVTSNFADVFRNLKSEKHLDPLNEVDKFCLHFVYMPIESARHWMNFSYVGIITNCPLKATKHLFSCFTRDYMSQASADSGSMGASSNSSPTMPQLVSNEDIQVPLNSYTPCSIVLTQIQGINPMGDSSDFGNIYTNL